MRVALYARVSTDDRDQDPETQLLALRDYARAQGWDVHGEYVDRAPANDLRGRAQWRRLLDDAAKRRFQVVAVFKLDRAFRSVKHLHDTLAVWEAEGVGFVSAREGFDTRTALGRLLMNLLASLAEFELATISERVRAGMERARREGRHVGRPRRQVDVAKAHALLTSGLSLRQAAKALRVPESTLRRALRQKGGAGGDDEKPTVTGA